MSNTRRFLALLLSGSILAPGLALADYLFTAPPRETPEAGQRIYGPIAAFLTQATGEIFSYRHPEGWANYTKRMQAGDYDLIFDGSHFVSWRTENADHVALVKLPQRMVWTIVASRSDPFTDRIGKLMGRKVCAPSSPNLGMLTLFSNFPNPVREPVQIRTLSWRDGFDSVVAGRCYAAVLPETNLQMFDPNGQYTKVLKRYDPMPNQAFTAGPRISAQLKQRVRSALLSPQGQEASKGLRDRFAKGQSLVAATNSEFRGVSAVLDNALGWGIYAY
jgi:hypothetical protein